jgi:hypothetical protein
MMTSLLRAIGLASALCYCALPATAQILTLMPLENTSVSPGPLLDACSNIGSWPTVASRTQFLGNADWSVDRLSDGDQQTCFANMNSAGISLALEVGVLKTQSAPCNTGTGCFWNSKPSWDRMTGNGAHIGAFFLDEPLTAVYKGWAPGNIVTTTDETGAYISLLHQYYPGAIVVEIEAYPFISTNGILAWIQELHYLRSNGNGPDYFELDDDLTQPQNYNDPYFFRDDAHGYGLGFSMLYSYTYGSGDTAFYVGTDAECNLFSDLNADSYHVSAFYNSPQYSTPETSTYTFTGTVAHLLSRGCVAG